MTFRSFSWATAPFSSRAVTCLAVLVLAALSGACAQEAASTAPAGGAKAKKQAAKPTPVAVAAVTVGDAQSVYTTTTTIQPEFNAEILSRTTGAVRELHHEEGDVVEEGRLLLTIDDQDQQMALKQAELTLAHLQTEFKRREKMQNAGILASQEFDDIRNQIEKAEADVDAAKLTLAYTRVRAPFTGRIMRRLVDLGANVSPGVALYQIMDVDPMLVRVWVPANRLGRVAPGQKIHLKRDADGAELAAVTYLVSPMVDQTTGTVKITARISGGPADLRPGDFVEARVVTELRENALLVPSVAVFEEQGQKVLYTVVDGKAVRQVVTVGFIESGRTEILEGISEDALIVVKGQRNLRDGMPVSVKEGPGAEDKAVAEKKSSGFTGASL
ncbi:efflux RND transporter periplasmic adaptor subunit [Acanthopleuribacter pedis]|uniref:Efflux RND transporter periplasmic adaptor subunit n=1 Tax=Acanthopleuribacter pedis TaxID=442870 RepID=A0A8J7QKT7_9BACT|nr:efflux RND transporter periplasmic adaptor subunit [Acanthopleuribacter pedis]MBO1319825.1 efflux RND transporter periplasmic adaptor subunit [Acanthopleuribacter pedis]